VCADEKKIIIKGGEKNGGSVVRTSSLSQPRRTNFSSLIFYASCIHGFFAAGFGLTPGAGFLGVLLRAVAGR
jgi:hypothetical protein